MASYASQIPALSERERARVRARAAAQGLLTPHMAVKQLRTEFPDLGEQHFFNQPYVLMLRLSREYGLPCYYRVQIGRLRIRLYRREDVLHAYNKLVRHRAGFSRSR